jgi:NADH:ubiquinone oxidoreductase subunit 2 (subunit N)
MLLYFCLELSGFLTYILLSFTYDIKDRLEGALKYFIINSIASIFILFAISIFYINILETSFLGISITYLNTPEINFLSVFAFITLFVGFLFKLGSFPCLFWIVDIYESLNFSILCILLTVHKFAFFYIFIKLLFHVFFMLNSIWIPLAIISAFGSLLIGTFSALVQFKLKRFIAYTSISQMGYLIFSVATGTITGMTNAFNFIVFYLISTIIILVTLNSYENKLNSSSQQLIYLTDLIHLRTKVKNSDIFMFILSVCSLANLPPLSTFFTKYFIMQELIFFSFSHSVIVILLCSVVSIYYYIRLIKIFIFDLPLNYVNNKLNVLNNFNYFSILLQCFYIFSVRLKFNKISYIENLDNYGFEKLEPNRFLFLLINNIKQTWAIFLMSVNLFLLIFFFLIV